MIIMKKKYLVFLLLLCASQLFAQNKGVLTEVKDPLIDSLIARRIAINKVKPTINNPVSNTVVSQMGYRVQVFYGSDRKETFNEQAKFKAMYPKLRTYITYKEPNYHLRIGDFRTRLEAQKMMVELRPAFPTLFIFREKINAPDLDN